MPEPLKLDIAINVEALSRLRAEFQKLRKEIEGVGEALTKATSEATSRSEARARARKAKAEAELKRLQERIEADDFLSWIQQHGVASPKDVMRFATRIQTSAIWENIRRTRLEELKQLQKAQAEQKESLESLQAQIEKSDFLRWIQQQGAGDPRDVMRIARKIHEEAIRENIKRSGMQELPRVVNDTSKAMKGLTASTIGATKGLSGILSILGGFAGMVPGAGGAFWPLQQAGFMLALGRVAFGGALAPILKLAGLGLGVGAMVAGTIQYADLEERLVRLRQAAGDAATPIGALTDKVLELARRTGRSAIETARASEELVKAGLTVDEAMGKAGETVLQFSRVAEIGADQAVRMLVNVSSQMNVDLVTAANYIVKAADISVASIAEMGEAFAQSGFAARSMKLSMEDLGGILAMLAQGGVRGSEAATALQWFIRALQAIRSGTATADAYRALERMGLYSETKAFQEGSLSVQQFLVELKKAGVNVEAATEIFGRFGGKAAAILINAAEKWDEYTAKARASQDLVASRDAELRNTIAKRWQELMSELGAQLIRLGEAATPLIRAFMGLLQVIEWILRLIPRPPAVSEIWREHFQKIAQGIGETLRLTPEELFKDQFKAYKVIQDLKTAVQQLFDEKYGNTTAITQEDAQFLREQLEKIFKAANPETLRILLPILSKYLSDLGSAGAFEALRVIEEWREQLEKQAKKQAEQTQQTQQATEALVSLSAAANIAAESLKNAFQAMHETARSLMSSPRRIDQTISTLMESFVSGFASDFSKRIVEDLKLTGGIFGVTAYKAGETAITIGKVIGDVAGALIAGAIYTVGMGIVNALFSIFRSESRSRTLRAGQMGYNPELYQSIQHRTGQGLATIPVYSRSVSFVPTVNVGGIYVTGVEGDHHRMANRIADTISRYVALTMETSLWRATLREEAMQEVF